MPEAKQTYTGKNPLVKEVGKLIPNYVKRDPIVSAMIEKLDDNKVLFITEELNLHNIMTYESLFETVPERELDNTKKFLEENKGSIFVTFTSPKTPLVTYSFDPSVFGLKKKAS